MINRSSRRFCLNYAIRIPNSEDRICQSIVVECLRGCDFLTKKKRPFSGASAQRYYRWGSYILVNSIKTWFKSQVVIDNPKGLIPCHFSKVAWLFAAPLMLVVRFSINQNLCGIHVSIDYGVLLKLCILRYFCLGNPRGHPKRYL